MKMKVKRNIILILCFCWAVQICDAQTNEGTEFWFGFMEHFDINSNVKVAMITSKFNTSGTVNIPNRNWSANYTVAADQVVIITLPNFVENIGSESFDNTGIQVVSNDPVSVYVHQYHEFRSEAAVVLPMNSLGSNYYTMTYTGVINRGVDYPSEFLVVATQDETKIYIELSDFTKGGNTKGEVLNISLNRGETYQIQAATGSGDLSGSFISGDKDFAVFSGNTWTEVPTFCDARDNLMEQMYSVDKWGKDIVTVPSANVNFDIFRIMASEDNTQVLVTGSTGTTDNILLNRGQFAERTYSAAKLIRADKPIQVGQFLVGTECGGHSIGDPSMVMLNSVTQTRDTVTLFNSSLQNIQENYINIISLTSDIPLVTVDGNAIPNSAKVESVGIDGFYSYISMQVSAGAHTVVSDGCGIIATAYGYGPAESYAYSGGASFNSINVNPIPDGGCLNDTVFFNANLPEERYSFLWDLGDDVTFDSPSFEIFYDELGSYPAQLILTDECVGTVDTFYKDILITLRQAVEAFGDTTICANETFILGATDVDAAEFFWNGPSGFFSEEQYPAIFDASESMSGSYEVVGIVSGCATFPSFAELEVLNLPVPIFEQNPIYCNLREEVLLKPGDFASYLWHDGSTELQFMVAEDGRYEVTVTDEFGCSDSLGINLIERCPTEVYIPNVFSPNDDGFNDVWLVFGHDTRAFDLEVKNRWGEIVFISQDVDQPWEGEYFGKDAVADVYFYTLKIEGYSESGEDYKETICGTVTLIR